MKNKTLKHCWPKNGQMTKDITMRISCFQHENMKCELGLYGPEKYPVDIVPHILKETFDKN